MRTVSLSTAIFSATVLIGVWASWGSSPRTMTPAEMWAAYGGQDTFPEKCCVSKGDCSPGATEEKCDDWSGNMMAMLCRGKGHEEDWDSQANARECTMDDPETEECTQSEETEVCLKEWADCDFDGLTNTCFPIGEPVETEVAISCQPDCLL